MLISITKSDDYLSAIILKNRLELEGIPAFVFDQNYAAIDWSHINAIGSVRVMVPESKIAESLSVIKRIAAGVYMEEMEKIDNFPKAREETLMCPKCSSENVSPLVESRRLMLSICIPFLVLLPVFIQFFIVLILGFLLKINIPITFWPSILIAIAGIIVVLYPKRFGNMVCNKCRSTWFKMYVKPYSAGKIILIMLGLCFVIFITIIIFYRQLELMSQCEKSTQCGVLIKK